MIVNIHQAKTNFSKLVAKFQAGEKIIIAKNGKPVLQFAPVPGAERPHRPIGFFHCDVDLSSFKEPLDELKEYQ